ncbi:MAG: HEAT repeat domain-containing protein [Deltaproteobacteria bacterium]|nr:HEAT repeat domain-containing protein [Deltaproteobacteria bacterium]
MKIFNFLGQDDLETGIDKICELPEKQAVNPLFSFLFNSDPLIKWRAVTAMGAVVSQLANKELEAARVIMRRLMWNLKKELADEYHRILISYLDPAGNYLEHQILQRGVLWGIGRFAHARPQLAKGSLPLFVPLIDSDDPYVRGLAGWICGFYWDSKENDALRSLAEDDTIITFYHNRQLKEISISSLVNQNV